MTSNQVSPKSFSPLKGFILFLIAFGVTTLLAIGLLAGISVVLSHLI